MKHQLGSTFSDHVVMGTRRMRRYDDGDQTPRMFPRILFMVCVLCIGVTVLFARMFFLMAVEGKRYAALAAGNRVREIILHAPRGIIYDRHRTPLVRNTPKFLSEEKNTYFDRPPEGSRSGWVEQIAREYTHGEAFGHVVGYVGEVHETHLKKGKGLYEIGDTVGMMGIEQSYDIHLRGVNGKELIETDALGDRIRTLGTIQPVEGKPLTLSLDADLQHVAVESLGSLVGAVVVQIPSTGEVLALVSSPSFDPNTFIRGDTSSLLTRSDQPLFHRAIAGQYPPASTFKIITSVAGLESKKLTAQTMFEDTGVLKVGEFSFGNWYFSQYGRTEGYVDVVTAMKRSNDIFFYKAAEAMGIETLAGWARAFGLGKPLGIDMYGEEKGLMPDPAWTKQVKKEPWYLGNTYHVSIGQGDVLATPLQVQSWTNVIATGGKLCTPKVAKLNQESSMMNQGEMCKDIEISPSTIRIVREGMKAACGEGGTGWPLYKFKVKNEKLKKDGVDFFDVPQATGSASLNEWVEIPVACKTGTAETGDPTGKTHAWFTAFAPINNPQIAVTVLVEKGGEGSTNAAPIAKQVLEEWFRR